MHKAHRIRLQPNNTQATHLRKACGIARFAYNWALEQWNTWYAARRQWPLIVLPPNEATLRREFNRRKHIEWPWVMEVSKCVPQLAIRDNLAAAFRNMFNGTGKHPRFHRKGVHDSFKLSNDAFKVDGRRLYIPKLGWVRMRERIRFDGRVLSCTVSRKADHWYASFTVDVADKSRPAQPCTAVGVDLGIKMLATLSTGEKISSTLDVHAFDRKLRRLHQRLSRQQGARKGERKSRNYLKTLKRLQRVYEHMANTRADDLHKLTTRLSDTYRIIGIEKLNTHGMMRNHRLAKHIANASFFEFARQLDYKHPVGTVKADRWYPSSRLCSQCHTRYDAENQGRPWGLDVREWVCAACGAVLDRDVNAAINLRDYAVSSTVSACGEFSASAVTRHACDGKQPRRSRNRTANLPSGGNA